MHMMFIISDLFIYFWEDKKIDIEFFYLPIIFFRHRNLNFPRISHPGADPTEYSDHSQ